MMKVERDRKLKGAGGIWGNFCTVSSAKEDGDETDEEVESKGKKSSKVLNEEEIRSVIESVNCRKEVNQSAPLFGPARKLSKFLFKEENK
jgi:hypothetical protein